jgi:hypothetical protein
LDISAAVPSIDTLGHVITSSPPVEGEPQASYACAISSFKLYPKAIRPYEAVGAQGKVIGISEGKVKGVAAVVFTASAAFNVAILGAGKVLARRTSGPEDLADQRGLADLPYLYSSTSSRRKAG